MDDPVYQGKAAAFTVRMIQRYADVPELFGWNVWNEAFIRAYCYCPITLAKFRDWLKAKYRDDLGRLNALWGTEFPVDYKTWDEIEPGLGTGFFSSGYVARLDWLAFNQAQVASWISGVNRLVREHDRRQRPTTSNVVLTAVVGNGHNHPDIWSQSRDLSITGISAYTTVGNAAQISSGWASVRGSSSDPGGGFWVLETEAGQVANPNVPPEVVDGPRRETMHWLSVLHGAKTILLWKFGGRVTDNQTEIFNLTAWDGSVTERARRNAQFARTFRDHEDLFLDTRYQARAAVLYSTRNALFAQVHSSHESWRQHNYGAWRVLRDLYIPGDFVSDVQVQVDEGRLSAYDLLILPATYSMDAGLAARLTDFVRNGGTLIADRCTAVTDENGRIFPQAPGHRLAAVFGGCINDFLLSAKEEPVLFAAPAATLTTYARYHAEIVPAADAAVLGTYANGKPAAISHRFGKGRVVWFGFDAFSDYDSHPAATLRTLLRPVLASAGIESDYEVGGTATDLELGALTGADGAKVHFLLNPTNQKQDFTLRIKSAQGRQLRDLLGDFVFDGGKTDGVGITLAPWQTRILS